MKRYSSFFVLLLVMYVAAACGSHATTEGDIGTISSAATAKNALFVVGNTTLGTGDAAVKARLVALGFTVTVEQDSASQTADATGKQLIVISSTVTSGNVNTKFTTVAVPILDWESALLDDLGMTTTTATDEGTATGQTQVQFNAPPSDFMTTGLSGSPTVTTSSQTFSWGKPAVNAVIVARLATDTSKSVIFRYEKSAQMVGRTAPERRVAFFLENTTAATLTQNGQNLLDAAIKWASHNDLSALGQPCTLASGCASGFCADGMCCNAACTANCLVCSAGTCGPSPANQPDGTCVSCDGAGTCPGFPSVGLMLRYEADPTTMVMSNNQITQWNDLSPNHYNFNVGSATFAPSIPAVILKDNLQMRSTLAKLGSFNSGMTLAVLLSAPQGARGASFFVDMDDFIHAAVYDDRSIGSLSVSYSTSGLANGGIWEWPSTMTSGSGVWDVLQVVQNGFDGTMFEGSTQGGDATIYVSGGPRFITDQVPVPATNNKTIQIGSVGGLVPVAVRAILLYNRVLNMSERAQLDTYLTTRWALNAGTASCVDGVMNQGETGVDCGGPCAACVSCHDGIQNNGETGVDCGGPNCGACPTCSDGIQNQGELGIDCGGPCYLVCPSCTDMTKNGDEQHIDCGGSCPSCGTCSDGVKNGEETGVDCGGSYCPVCATCTDGIKNGTEKGIDCGGPCAPCYTEVLKILTTNCSGCHSASFHFGGLSLATNINKSPTPPAQPVNLPYTDLVGHASAPTNAQNPNQGSCGGRTRVVAGNPAQSLLYLKTHSPGNPAVAPVCGTFMPAPSGFLAEQDQATIENWIKAGAKDN